jgi:exodeoxyribonuclease VII large subunit
MAVLTVTQLNRYVTFRLKEDVRLNSILVRGEISGFTRNLRSGHCYFTLKDAESSVKAVLFRSQANRLRIPLENGMRVIAAASATLYEREGTFQLYVTDLQADGVGQQQAEKEMRKKKLLEMGVFDAAHKKTLPAFPKKIGVVTSASGAAIHDITQVIRRRFPLVQLCLFPAQVQGEDAPKQICQAIAAATKAACDILIVGRGGGSEEDLQAFQTEEVVMAVYRCPIPVISAVGHETDETLTDYAADLRAPTPSAAAELAVPELSVLYQQIAAQQNRLQSAMQRQLEQKKSRLQMLEMMLTRSNPMRILERGYAIVSHNNQVISTSDAVQTGEHLTIQLAHGTIEVQVVAQKGDTDDV